MNKMDEVREIEHGKYTFFIGVHQYTLSTSIDKERFTRIIKKIQQLVDSFPQIMSQEDRLLLSLMTSVNELDKVESQISGLIDTIGKEMQE